MLEITLHPHFQLSVFFHGTTHSDALVPPTRAASVELPTQAKFQADAGGPADLAIATTSEHIGTKPYQEWSRVFDDKAFYSIPTHPISLSFV